MSSVDRTGEIDGSTFVMSTPSDVKNGNMIHTPYGSCWFPFPFPRAAAIGVWKGMMSIMNKNDCHWKEHIVSEKLHLDVVFQNVEVTIEQVNKKVRACK